MKHIVKFRGETKEFYSPLTTSEAVDVCWGLITAGLLPEQTTEFLRELHGRWRQYRVLTEAQAAWVQYYATSQHVKKGRQATPEANAAVEQLDGAKLIEMFTKAQGKGGEIRLQCPQMFVNVNGREVKLKFCGPRTKNPGGLYLTNGDEYLGKITKEGRLMPVRMLFDGLIEALQEFCKDPVAFAVRFARVTGRCCFCGLELTNRHSIYHGYGPICADHWGLPHGNAPDDWQPSLEAHGRVVAQDLKDGA